MPMIDRTSRALERGARLLRSFSLAAIAIGAAGMAAAPAQAQYIPDLSSYPADIKQNIETACGPAYYRGPADYARCLREKIAIYERNISPPDLSIYSASIRQNMEAACGDAYLGGPAAYAQCLREQVRALGAYDQRPSLLPDLAVPETEPETQDVALPVAPDARVPAAPDAGTPGVGLPAAPDAGAPVGPVGPGIVPSMLVLEIQVHLKTLGYDLGEPDGLGGPRTRSAIIAYERATGRYPSGVPSRALLEALRADAAGQSSRAVVASPPPRAAQKADAAGALPRPSGVLPSPLPPRAGAPLDAADLFGVVAPSVWTVAASPSYAAARQGEGAQGSAVAVTPSLLLTNCHVVVGPVLALIQGHTIVPASLVARDVTGDRCVLEPMEPVALKPVPVRAYADLRVGEKVYTIGSPRGFDQSLGEGVVSGLRDARGGPFVQTTAAISPGSSGGGLFDANGNLIGITTLVLKDSQSLNFAIAAESFWVDLSRYGGGRYDEAALVIPPEPSLPKAPAPRAPRPAKAEPPPWQVGVTRIGYGPTPNAGCGEDPTSAVQLLDLNVDPAGPRKDRSLGYRLSYAACSDGGAARSLVGRISVRVLRGGEVLVEDTRTFTTKPGQWADSRTISLARNLPAGSYTLDVRLFLKGRVLRLNSDFDAS